MSLFSLLDHPSTALALLKAAASTAVYIEQIDDGLEPSESSARASSSSSPTGTHGTEMLDLYKGPYVNMAHSKNQDERFRSLSIGQQQSHFATARLEVISPRYHFYGTFTLQDIINYI